MEENAIINFYNTFKDKGRDAYFKQKTLLFSKNGFNFSFKKKDIRKFDRVYSKNDHIYEQSFYFDKQFPQIIFANENFNKDNLFGLRFYYDSLVLFEDEEIEFTCKNNSVKYDKNNIFIRASSRRLIFENYNQCNNGFELFVNSIMANFLETDKVSFNIKITKQGSNNLRKIAEQNSYFSANKIFLEKVVMEMVRPVLKELAKNTYVKASKFMEKKTSSTVGSNNYEIQQYILIANIAFNGKLFNEEDADMFTIIDYSKKMRNKDVNSILQKLKNEGLLANYQYGMPTQPIKEYSAELNKITQNYDKTGNILAAMSS